MIVVMAHASIFIYISTTHTHIIIWGTLSDLQNREIIGS